MSPRRHCWRLGALEWQWVPSPSRAISTPGKAEPATFSWARAADRNGGGGPQTAKPGTRGTSKVQREKKVEGKFTRPGAWRLLLASFAMARSSQGQYCHASESWSGLRACWVTKASSFLPSAHPLQSWHFLQRGQAVAHTHLTPDFKPLFRATSVKWSFTGSN